LFFVTCGTSVSSSSRCWRGCEAFDALSNNALRHQPNASTIEDTLARVRAALLGRMGSDPEQFDRKAAAVASEAFRRECWARRPTYLLSAELATLRAIAEGEPDVIQPTTRIVLLSGKNEREREASLVGGVLRSLAADGVFATQHVERHPPFDWEPTDSARFSEQMRFAWESINLQTSQVEPEQVSLVLTGGYKGILLSLALRVGAFANPKFHA